MKVTVISLLEEGYSPEQIKGRSNVEGFAMVSHETIYRWIWEDKHKNGTLHLNLRRKGKKYNKRGNLIHTITADNGKEFAKHQEIAKELDISFYFCKPYHSWERGANENSPQKRLGYLTPNEKFNLLLTNQNSGCICKLNSP